LIGMARFVLILTILAMLAAATSAQATYPGRNGGIGYTFSAGSGEVSPITSSGGLAFRRNSGASDRVLVRCGSTDDVPDADCPVTSFSSPTFSPTGKLIAFDAGPRIGLIAASGGAVTLLPGATSDDGDPAFTPDGKRIVFTGANDHGTTDLYVRAIDGTGGARLLLQDAAQPAVSVRGVLAYVRSGNVYLRVPKKGKRRWVTSGIFPDWSPDGRRLVIVRPNPRLTFDVGIGRVYTVRSNGHGLSRVGRQNFVSHPVWSPDGRSIAYDDDFAGIWVKRLDSRQEPEIWAESQQGDEDSYSRASLPAWRPL
jgi:Tol biopolymer transport system component